MPTSTLTVNGTGSFATGQTVTWPISIPWNDPTNPFVHTYHPDHDNKDPAGRALGEGKESFSISRSCQFTFTASPPDGRYIAGWGSTILGGTYRETLTGLHKRTLEVRGTFQMRRVSEIATLDMTPPPG